MTFIPTPKLDLAPIDALSEVWAALGQQLLSRLYHAQADADATAAAIADLYSRTPGAGSIWRWAGTAANVNPGVGRLSVIVLSGNNRSFTVSETDADGHAMPLGAIAQGSTLVLTDDPATPPTTAFRSYVVTTTPVDHGNWVSFSGIRTSTFGTQTVPPVDSRVRLLLR